MVGSDQRPSPSEHVPWVPAVGWLRTYRPAWLRPDLLAGLTCAAVVIPQAMAYATIVGLPVQVGLYTALVPLRLPAQDRDLRERGVTLRLANSSERMVRLLERAPDPTGLADRLFAGINDAVAGRRN